MLAVLRKRTLPFWPVSETLLRPFCRPAINNILLVSLFLLLFIALFAPHNATVLAACVVAFAALIAMDWWRVFYYQYWWWLMAALAFEQPFTVARVWLAALYTFSGLAKLVKRDFYEWVGPQTMLPVILILEKCRLVPTLDDARGLALGRKLACAAVLVETLLGLVLVVDVVYMRGFAPEWLLATNLAMHLYIIVGIGVFNNIRTFWSWNGMCACITQLVFSRAFNAAAEDETFGWLSVAATLVLAIYPLSLFVGDGWCLDATMGHAYFVTGWFGVSTLLLPLKGCRERLPSELFGQPIPCFSATEERDRFESIIRAVCKAFKGRENELLTHLGLTTTNTLADELLQSTFACDTTMIDVQFRVDAQDVHKEYFSTHLSSFWRALAHEHFGTHSGVHVLRHQYRSWSAPIDRVTLLQ